MPADITGSSSTMQYIFIINEDEEVISVMKISLSVKSLDYHIPAITNAITIFYVASGPGFKIPASGVRVVNL